MREKCKVPPNDYVDHGNVKMTSNFSDLLATIVISSATAIVVTFATLTGIGMLLASQDIILVRRIYVDHRDMDKAPRLLLRTAAGAVRQPTETFPNAYAADAQRGRQ